ncbi:MAG: hypothetical protein EOO77_37590 [Oxalobacteraceae bacterium]|nr:MAG: hypothetical protein EOO77_37590 [Oxalobacteraceae bacterium]
MKLGFIDDVSEVLETVISEGGRQGPILAAETVVDDLDGTILGKHADGRVGNGVLGLAQQSGRMSQSVDATCCSHV